jgi:flagellar P-ring protein precursor FlgI
MRLIVVLLAALAAWPASAARIKDISQFSGPPRIILVGYGVVVGLNGSGDRQSVLSDRSLNAALERMGMTVAAEDIKSRNVAAVMVTAQLPARHGVGQPVDITASSIGDARSLEGGVLLRTLLYGPGQEALVVAQGSLVVGPLPGGAGKGNVARLPGGGIALTTDASIVSEQSRIVRLRQPDLATAMAVQEAVRAKIPGATARALDGGEVEIRPPAAAPEWIPFLAAVEALEVITDTRARVVYDPRSGVLVMGGQIQLRPAAVSVNGIDIRLEGGEGRATFQGIGTDPTLQDLIAALNAMHASPADVATALEALQRAGMLLADLEVL